MPTFVATARATTTWTPDNGGTASASSADGFGTGTELTGEGNGYSSFQASPFPTGTRFTYRLQGRSYVALYIGVTSNVGDRQFKVVPDEGSNELQFGYRYSVKAGKVLRNGEVNDIPLDLPAISAALEPGVAIEKITKIFVQVKGSVILEIAAGAVPLPLPTAGGDTASEAVRFLTQTTFGATSESLRQLNQAGSYEAWIDQQLALPASLTRPYTRANANSSNDGPRHQAWWRNVLHEPDQLRQRLAFAWSEIFVISDIDYELRLAQYAITGYYDMLAIQSTANFREMLEKVTLSPVMGIYLSMLRNQKADPSRNIRPDENFAREVLQLFTIGLYELSTDGRVMVDRNGEPIPTYDQAMIEQFARVFTGWNLKGAPWTSGDLTKYDKESPMVPVQTYHDTTAKTLLNGVTIPAGGTAQGDLTAALDNIFDHPNVAPFLARQIIKRLITSNPSVGYVGRVAAVFNDNGDGVRGDLAAMTKALLLDDEARTGPTSGPGNFGKIKEPLIRLAQLWRAFDVEPGPASDGMYKTVPKTLDGIDSLLGQEPVRSPSVFNFFLPDNPVQAGNPSVAPELQIHTEINVASANNMLFECIYLANNRTGPDTKSTSSRIDVEREIALAADPEALIDHLDLLLLAGTIPAGTRALLLAHLQSLPDSSAGHYQRALDAIFCIVASPLHLVQK